MAIGTLTLKSHLTDPTDVTVGGLYVGHHRGQGTITGIGDLTVTGGTQIGYGNQGAAPIAELVFGDGTNAFTADLAFNTVSNGSFYLGLYANDSVTPTEGKLTNLATDSSVTFGGPTSYSRVYLGYNNQDKDSGVIGEIDIRNGTLDAKNVYDMSIGYNSQPLATGTHTGTLDVSGGTVVGNALTITTGELSVGRGRGGVGQLLLPDTMTGFSVGSNMRVGSEYDGTGTVAAEGVTDLTVGGTLYVGQGSGSEVAVGTLTLKSDEFNPTNITAAGLQVGMWRGQGTITGVGNLTIGGTAHIGYGSDTSAPTAVVEFGDGSNPFTASLAFNTVSNGQFNLGVHANNSGTATVGTLANLATDSSVSFGDTFSYSQVYIGYNTSAYDSDVTGVMNISTGTLDAKNLYEMHIGRNAQPAGTGTITGTLDVSSGTVVGNALTITTGDLSVGRGLGAVGQLLLPSSTTQISTGGGLYVGSEYNGQGTLTAAGVTTLNVGSTLAVGYGTGAGAAQGTLTLGGADISASQLIVGFENGSGTITGAADLTIAGTIHVGYGNNTQAPSGVIDFVSAAVDRTIAIVPNSGTANFNYGAYANSSVTATKGEFQNLSDGSTLRLGTTGGNVDVYLGYNNNDRDSGVEGVLDLSDGRFEAVNVRNVYIGYSGNGGATGLHTGSLDLSAATLSDGTTDGQASISGQLNVGRGRNTQGTLRLGDGTFSVASHVYIGHDSYADSIGLLDLNSTLMQVGGGFYVQQGGTVDVTFGGSAAGLDFLAGSTFSDSTLTGGLVTFDFDTASAGIWGIRVLGDQETMLNGMITAGKIANTGTVNTPLVYTDPTYTYYGLLGSLVWDDDTADHNWATATNWDPDPDIPDAVTEALVDNGTTANVTTTGQEAFKLTIRNAGSTVNVASGGQLSATNSVVVETDGTLSVTGELNAPQLDNAGTTTFASGSSGSIGTINQAGGTLTLSTPEVTTLAATGGTTNVGASTDKIGALNVSGTALVNVTDSAKIASATVSGTGSVLQLTGGDLTVDTLDLSAETGTVNTQSNQVNITAGNSFESGDVTFSSTVAAGFGLKGSNLVDPGQARALVLGGGTVSVVAGGGGAGAQITGLTAYADSQSGWGTPAANAVNGVGLTGDLHSNTYSHMWLNGGANPGGYPVNQAYFYVNLGAEYSLGEMWLWNYNQSGYPTRGIRQVDLYYSTSATNPGSNFPADWTLFQADYEFAQANGLANLPATDVVDLSGVTARWFAFDIDTNWGYSDVGISEMRFYQSAAAPLELALTDLEVTDYTTLDLTGATTAEFGDLIADLSLLVPGETLLEINSDSTSITFRDLYVSNATAMGIYTLLDWTDQPGGSSVFYDGMFDNVYLDGFSGTLAYTDTQVRLTVIPEPATMALLALGGAAVLLRRRRRR